ncbi:MAG: dihydrodipicolinate synthase family protein [Clostridia bacterium]|nr:dihydrodipicolinate synthase family protein [Clostridia bacterium]
MTAHIEKGLWPVMLTPFTAAGEIDYASLERLIDWYEKNGATGLFAACQSSEIFFLSLRERVELVRFVKAHAHVPVIASGHTSYGLNDQINELKAIAGAGPDALILITNRLCPAGRQGESILPAVDSIMAALPADMPLGFYECPYPFKRLISTDELKRCADTGRFAFMKDTCCDIGVIGERLAAIRGSALALYNANTTTLLASLRLGAAGFSGVMMNFHMDLYRELARRWDTEPDKAETLQGFLTGFSEIERQYYPVNAKYHQKVIEGVFEDAFARVAPQEGLTATFRDEVHQMHRAACFLRETLLK